MDQAHGAGDIDLFAGVEKWRGKTYIGFGGSYGFGRDRITTGWLKASLRCLDEQASRPFDAVPACTQPQPLAPGQVTERDMSSVESRPGLRRVFTVDVSDLESSFAG